MDKLGRNYILSVASQNDGPLDLIITLPITIEFDITRNTLTSANVCQVRIYNLSELRRNQLRFNSSDYGHFRPIVLVAGYGNTLATVFTGNISQAWSVREGTNFITQIECYDGGFAFNNGQVNLEFPAGTPQKTVIQAIGATLPRTSLGAVGDYPGVTGRGNSYSGNAMKILGELTGGGAFIDNGKFNALGTNEYIASLAGIGFIDSSTGLLGTPILEQTIVRFDMLFEPGLNAGQQILLNSSTEANFNGQYKVIGVKHRGMISDAVCGSVITTGEFFYSKLLKAALPG